MKALLFLVVLFAISSVCYAQNSSVVNGTNTTTPERQPDVHLIVPHIGVDLIQLNVKKINVTLNLQLAVGSLVQLKAGVNAFIEEVDLRIENVSVQAELIVHLDNVVAAVDYAMTTIAEHPEIITGLIDAVGGLLDEVAGVLTQTIDALGRVVQTVIDSAGNIISQILGEGGNVVSKTVVGNVQNLVVLASETNAAGQLVNMVQNTDGSVFNLTYDKPGGKILGIVPISGPTAPSTTSSSSSTTAATSTTTV